MWWSTDRDAVQKKRREWDACRVVGDDFDSFHRLGRGNRCRYNPIAEGEKVLADTAAFVIMFHGGMIVVRFRASFGCFVRTMMRVRFSCPMGIRVSMGRVTAGCRVWFRLHILGRLCRAALSPCVSTTHMQPTSDIAEQQGSDAKAGSKRAKNVQEATLEKTFDANGRKPHSGGNRHRKIRLSDCHGLIRLVNANVRFLLKNTRI